MGSIKNFKKDSENLKMTVESYDEQYFRMNYEEGYFNHIMLLLEGGDAVN